VETVAESLRASRDRARVAITAAFGSDVRGRVRETEEGGADLINDLLHSLQGEFDLGTMVQVNGVPVDDVSGEEAVLGVLAEVVGRWLCESRASTTAPDEEAHSPCGGGDEVTISAPGVTFGQRIRDGHSRTGEAGLRFRSAVEGPRWLLRSIAELSGRPGPFA
jgi:hypothetical protein